MSYKTDLQIAQETKLQHINEIAAKLNIDSETMELYGKYKAKLPLDLIDEEKVKQNNMKGTALSSSNINPKAKSPASKETGLF